MGHPRTSRISLLLDTVPPPLVLIQLRIESEGTGFVLRHHLDADVDRRQLRAVALDELASLADVTASGAFRPNKAAPTLQRGWICAVVSREELEWGLDRLYPSAVADWFAARGNPGAATSFREFTGRQTGMYRGIQSIGAPLAAAITQTACSPEFCLRQRRWAVPGLPPDDADSKSFIPCLDPCGLYLEFARRCTRMAQDPTAGLELGKAEFESLDAALTRLIEMPAPEVREGDTAHPLNPRRLHFLRERIRSRPPIAKTGQKEA